MPIERELESLRPSKKPTVYELLKQIRFDVSDWAHYKKPDKPAANPKYCYNWSFDDESGIAACIWHAEIGREEGQLVVRNNLRANPTTHSRLSAGIWRRRARELDRNIQFAYLNRMPVRVIVLDGKRRDRHDPDDSASSVKARLLDEKSWAVTQYDFDTGDFALVRGLAPIVPFATPQDDIEETFEEGEQRRRFRKHRHHERRARMAKIADAKRLNGGRLQCEVTNCGFDFHARYGPIGENFAHVHHLSPLSWNAGTVKTKLSDLAVVCANCHAMIHIGGACRDIKTLIPES